MDVARLRLGETVALAGALGLLISLFLDWFGVDGAGAQTEALLSTSGWGAFGPVVSAIALAAVALAIALAAATAARRPVALPVALAVLTSAWGSSRSGSCSSARSCCSRASTATCPTPW
jgi:hypothetical protein